jgi:hypothetical protein
MAKVRAVKLAPATAMVSAAKRSMSQPRPMPLSQIGNSSAIASWPPSRR